jgi:NADPH-dependent ferric siderophore reductase
MSAVKSALLRVLGPRLFAQARIVRNEAISTHFRLIDLASEALHSAVWRPGGKVQLNTGDWVMRTYTPLSIDTASAQLRLLVYLHGAGPGSSWASSAQPGDITHLIGPDRSLRAPDPGTPLIVFGDETAFALAAGLERSSSAQRSRRFFFEVSDAREAEAVLRQCGIQQATLLSKGTSSSLHASWSEAVQSLAGGLQGHALVLAGRAQSIQAQRALLKGIAVPGSQVSTKAYWSLGKRGLD